ncbi:hypothetical protein FPQ18DRAFT_395913 [Pyronema domesticum]|nr:hypothetical protein FPQ18DRAFT_395913 [Pyronema domesticum]
MITGRDIKLPPRVSMVETTVGQVAGLLNSVIMTVNVTLLMALLLVTVAILKEKSTATT